MFKTKSLVWQCFFSRRKREQNFLVKVDGGGYMRNVTINEFGVRMVAGPGRGRGDQND